MLRANKSSKPKGTVSGAAFAIVASEYNRLYVDAMVSAAQAELKRAGASSIRVVRVPGAFEIPDVAARLARESQQSKKSYAIICLGVILRGETTHAAHIGEAVTNALMDIQLRYEVPVIHEVLLLENEQQAKVRCMDAKHNRGMEAAQTAVAMANTLGSL